jgi:hypothetical protein
MNVNMDFSKSWRVALAAVLFVFAAGARGVNACSCDANPPCAAVWRADAVFIGTVVDRVPERIRGSLSWTVNKVAVSETFRGSVGSFLTLVPGGRPTAEQIDAAQSHPGELSTMSTCDYDFELGTTYLIYAHRTPDGRLTTSKCSGTKRLDKATADLDYIATFPNAAPTGRIYGTVERMVLDPTNRSEAIAVPAPGVRIAIVSGTNRLAARTDVEGKLDVDVPPGEYSIAPVVPDTVRMYGAPLQASVSARGCAPVYFALVSNGRIEGRVVRSDGTPVSRASVDVIPADLPPGEPPDSLTTSPSGSTNEDGQFAIDAILPGRYVVAVNARFGPRLFAPYPTTYLPGVGRADARVVEVGEGERQNGFTIVVDPLPERTVTGMVVSSDGGPVGEASITAAHVDHRGMIMASAKTDSDGTFQLRLLAGVTYLIRASIRTSAGFKQVETVVLVDQQTEAVRLSIGR